MTIKIKSNHHKRPICNAWEVPADVWRDRFESYRGIDQDQADGSYVCFKGWWYDLNEFVRGSSHECASCRALGRDPSPRVQCDFGHVPYWHGLSADTWSCGVVIRLTNDGERAILGTWRA